MDQMIAERSSFKNPYQALSVELKEEYGMSPIEIKALVRKMQEFIEQETIGERKNNQIVRTVVAFGEPAGKKIKDCKLITVNLTMAFYGEEKILKEKGLKYLKELKVHQLVFESYNQGGLLSHEDIQDILGISRSTIKRIIKKYKSNNIIVPTRGQIEDIGPGITHKERIIELIIKGYLYSDIMIMTAHTEASIENYEKKFVKIAYFYKEGKTELKIRLITGYSEALIKSFIELYKNNKKNYPELVENILKRYEKYIEFEEKKTGKYNDKYI